MSTLSEAFSTVFEQYSDRELVTIKKHFAYERYSYAQMHDLSLRMVTLLRRQRLKSGDTIAITSYNCPAYLVTMYASILMGVVLVPLDYAASDSYCQKLMQKTNCKLLIRSTSKIVTTRKPEFIIERLFEQLNTIKPARKLPKVADDALMEILFTSGTTGDPKGVMVTHENIYTNIIGVAQTISLRADFRALSMLPLSHIFEQIVALALTMHGASMVQMKSRRGSEISSLLVKERINTLATVPAFLELLKHKILEGARAQGKEGFLQKLLAISPRLPVFAQRILFTSIRKKLGLSLTRIVSGGAPISHETETFWALLGMQVYKGYGLTETGAIVSATPDGKRRLGAVGKPILGVKVRLSSEQEIQVKGANVMPGYFRNALATKKTFTEDGWLKTGDIGEIDDGYLYIRGRVKNMILKANGKNVYPEDIEAILHTEAMIKDCCVVGIEHAHDVAVTAVLLLHPDRKKLSKKQLQLLVNRVNNQLERYQHIQDTVIWPEADFPRTLTLKIKRKHILEKLEDHATSSGAHDDPLISLLSSMTHKSVGDIEASDGLYADLGLDSLSVINLAVRIEESLRVQIPQQMITSKTTVGELSTLVEQGSTIVKPLTLLSGFYWSIFDPLRKVYPRFLTWLASAYFTPLQVEGTKHVEAISGPVLIASNHTSMLDTPVLYAQLPWSIRKRLAIGGREDYFFSRPGLLGRLMKYTFITIGLAFPLVRESDDPTKSVSDSFTIVGELVDKGYSIMLYPEGTRNPLDTLLPFKKGLGLLVQETGLPVLPVRLVGLNKILPKGEPWPIGDGSVTVRFGKMMHFGVMESAEEITGKVEKAIQALGN